MSVQYRPAASPGELQAILELQGENLRDSLTPEEREREGFVTLRYTLQELAGMQAQGPQMVAFDGDRLIGYALSLTPGLRQQVPTLEPLFSVLEKTTPPLPPYRLMGQVCIRKGYRGVGHLRALYERLKERVSPDTLVTEISQENRRSLKAHGKMGFKKIAERQGEGQVWDIVLWE
ncbi:GNAT family N-acetyltransferase [Robiginitalea marina]|uniref:GNAT family N-acetyltransferase n=1 Tax=Robiginitalea marina TaxID=2954105 RepID=A0ABT1AX45_9FLAO|nr:GNAT family N-acetyltransferase [Robiginitalea marina]MCO5724494.1 GNAT family N-acetyltransferase [Robiginitalea marina]